VLHTLRGSVVRPEDQEDFFRTLIAFVISGQMDREGALVVRVMMVMMMMMMMMMMVMVMSV
jgi:hypothetical protein